MGKVSLFGFLLPPHVAFLLLTREMIKREKERDGNRERSGVAFSKALSLNIVTLGVKVLMYELWGWKA